MAVNLIACRSPVGPEMSESDVFAKPPSGVASDVAGRAHPCAENLRGSNHGPGNVETWRILDDGYGKQPDIIC